MIVYHGRWTFTNAYRKVTDTSMGNPDAIGYYIYTGRGHEKRHLYSNSVNKNSRPNLN